MTTPQQRYGLSNPHKVKANSALNKAVKKGVVVRPSRCEECGTVPTPCADGRSGLHGHHAWGYDQPLRVKWVCARCHKTMDRTTPGSSNGRAKLTEADVVEIRKRHQPNAKWWAPEGGARSLAREFGVSERTIRRIIKREIWIDAALSGSSVGRQISPPSGKTDDAGVCDAANQGRLPEPNLGQEREA